MQFLPKDQQPAWQRTANDRAAAATRKALCADSVRSVRSPAARSVSVSTLTATLTRNAAALGALARDVAALRPVRKAATKPAPFAPSAAEVEDRIGLTAKRKRLAEVKAEMDALRFPLHGDSHRHSVLWLERQELEEDVRLTEMVYGERVALAKLIPAEADRAEVRWWLRYPGEVVLVARGGSFSPGSVEVLARGNNSYATMPLASIRAGDVVLHNHPGGDLTPSEADIDSARALAARGCASVIVSNDVDRARVLVEPAALGLTA